MKFIHSVFFYIALLINGVICSCMLFFGFLPMISYKQRQNFLHGVGRLWAKNSIKITFTRRDISGQENIDTSQNYIVVSNHCSGFDIFMLLAYMNLRIIFISKDSNFRIPFIGLSMKILGYIPVNRSNNRMAWKSIELASDAYRKGHSIVIFPEGTRSSDGTLLPFKSGFLHLAKKNEVQILPVSLSGTYRIRGNKSWYIHPVPVKMVIGKPFKIAPDEINTQKKKEVVLARIEAAVRSGLRDI